MVVLYVSRTFRNFTASHISSLETKLGVDLYLIADEPFFGRQKDPATAENGLRQGKPVFDAYTAYNMFQNARVREGESALAYIRREAMPVYRGWSEKTVFCPGVLPRYHDFRGNKPLAGTMEQYISMIRDMRKLPSKPVGDSVNQIYLITSFNEWWEGTTQYEGGARVPFIIRWPGRVSAGSFTRLDSTGPPPASLSGSINITSRFLN